MAPVVPGDGRWKFMITWFGVTRTGGFFDELSKGSEGGR
jgi:hypothetical protein